MVASSWADEVRRFDRGRFQGALLAQGEAREALLTLYAFNLEIARLREKVREPGAGALRLQWWREELERLEDGGNLSHPLSKELARFRQDRFFDGAPLHALLDAREADWSPCPFPDRKALLAYADATGGGLNRVALSLLGVRDSRTLDAGRLLGQAWAVMGLIRAVPFQWSAGRICLPSDDLAKERLSAENLAAKESRPALCRLLLDLARKAAGLVEEARMARGQTGEGALPVLFQAVQIEGFLRSLRKAGGDPFASDVADAGLPVAGFIRSRLFGFW